MARAYLQHQAAGLHCSAAYRKRMTSESLILDPPSAGQPQRSLLLGAIAGLAAGLVLALLVLGISGVSGRRLKAATA
jgi:hypothetical protein